MRRKGKVEFVSCAAAQAVPTTGQPRSWAIAASPTPTQSVVSAIEVALLAPWMLVPEARCFDASGVSLFGEYDTSCCNATGTSLQRRRSKRSIAVESLSPKPRQPLSLPNGTGVWRVPAAGAGTALPLSSLSPPYSHTLTTALVPIPRSSPLTPRPLTRLAWFSCEIVAHPVAHEVFPLRRALLSTLSRNVLLSTPCYRLCNSQVVAPQNRFLSRRHRIVDSTALAVASPTLWSLLQPRGLLVRCFGKPS